MTATYRGSRKHVLDWVSRPTFVTELLALCRGVEVRVNRDSRWMPLSYKEPEEARLEEFGPRWYSLPSVWNELQDWWLVHKSGANTPNWDIALGCEILGKARPRLGGSQGPRDRAGPTGQVAARPQIR